MGSGEQDYCDLMSDTVAGRLEVVGRSSEIDAIRAFIESAAQQPSGFLIQGQAGIGKTTLWKVGIATAKERGYTILQCRGAPLESALSFAALGDLLEDRMEELSELPDPQRNALEVALHRVTPGDDRPDPLAVHRAFHSVISELERAAPVIVAIDDAQWIDRSSAAAVSFAMRRAAGLRVGVLLTLRDEVGPMVTDALHPGLDELRAERLLLSPLSLGAMHHILRAGLGTTFHRPMLLRIQEMARGNPFFALEIGRAILGAGVAETPGQIPPVPPDLKHLLTVRLSSLAPSTQDVLFVFTAWPEATIDQVASMLEREVDSALGESAEAGIIFREGNHVRFTHPLLASVIYEEAPVHARVQIHGQIADQTRDLEERARHRARTVIDKDEAVADLLDEAAAEALSRGATHSAADLYEQSIQLTPVRDSEQRSRRILNLASCLMAVGDPEKARLLLESSVETMTRNDTWVDATLALIEACYLSGDSDAILRHGDAALLDLPKAPRLRGKLHCFLSWLTEDFPLDRSIEHARAAIELLDPELDAPLLAIGFHNLFYAEVCAGREPREELLERALRLESAEDTRYNLPPGLYWKCIDDYSRARRRFEAHLARDTDRGDLTWVAFVYAHLAEMDLWAGNWDLAGQELDAGEAALDEMGSVWSSETHIYVKAMHELLRGDVDLTRTRIASALQATASPYIEAMYRHVLGFDALLHGDPAHASVQLQEAQRRLDELGVREPLRFRLQQDLIEALAATGHLEQARSALGALERRARVLPRPWLDVCVPRCRALVFAAGGEVAAALQAFESESWMSKPLPLEVGRNWLVLGRLRRRAKQKTGAKEAFERAIEIFESLPSPPFAAIARSEVERVGIRRSVGLELTEGERRVAELAASGMTTREVAEALFVSAKTVEANLSRVYQKLGISSRAELGSRMNTGS